MHDRWVEPARGTPWPFARIKEGRPVVPAHRLFILIFEFKKVRPIPITRERTDRRRPTSNVLEIVDRTRGFRGCGRRGLPQPGVPKAYVSGALKRAEAVIAPTESKAATAELVKVEAVRPWNHEIKLTAEEERSLGLGICSVVAQTEPIQLELTGRTAYDPDTLTKIRPRFDTLVEQVNASLGQTVKKGNRWSNSTSTELAAAKSDFQEKYVQWQHDLKLFNLRQELVKTGAISKQLWVDTINDEKKTRLEYTLARDRLQILKVPDEEIEPLLGPCTMSRRSWTPSPRGPSSVTSKARPR